MRPTTLYFALASLLMTGCSDDKPRYEPMYSSAARPETRVVAPEIRCYSEGKDQTNTKSKGKLQLRFSKNMPLLSPRDRADLEKYVEKLEFKTQKVYVAFPPAYRTQAECAVAELDRMGKERFQISRALTVESIENTQYKGVIISSTIPNAVAAKYKKRTEDKFGGDMQRNTQTTKPTRSHSGQIAIQDHPSGESKFYELIKGDKPVVVDFYATWCGPCKSLGKDLEDMKREYAGQAEFLKVNVDSQKSLTAKVAPEHQGDTSLKLPTVLIYQRGTLMSRIKGYNPNEIRRTLDSLL